MYVCTHTPFTWIKVLECYSIFIYTIPKWKCKWPLIGQWKIDYAYNFFSSVKQEELGIHATMWMNHKITVWNRLCQSQYKV